MALLIRALCQILIVHGALQCYQVRLEFADQAFGDNDNVYHEVNGGSDFENTDLGNKAEIPKNVPSGNKYEKGEDDEQNEAPEMQKDSSGEVKIDGQKQRAKTKKKRLTKNERLRSNRYHRPNYYNKDSDLPDDSKEEDTAGRDHESARFYSGNPYSDFTNMTDISMLRFGPVSNQIVDPPMKKTINSNFYSKKLSLNDVENFANISSVHGEFLSFIHSDALYGEQKRGNKRKLKSQKNASKGYGNDELINRHGESVLVKKKKDNLDKSTLYLEDCEIITQRTSHKSRKHMKIDSESIGLNAKKNIENDHLNEENEYANSITNKHFRNRAGETFDSKDNICNTHDFEASLDKEKSSESAKIVVDKMSNEDAKKLRSINRARVKSEEQSRQGNGSIVVGNKNNYANNTRSNRRKGIWSKIEYGDWVTQVTLLPLPDYSPRKKKTQNKNKLSSLRSQKGPFDDSIGGERVHNSKNHKKT